MLYLIPRPAHRLGYRCAHALRKTYWRIARPTVLGCCVIARNDAGAVLLVRASYGKGRWQFPGGGMDHGEDPIAAARREFSEETSLDLVQAKVLGLRVEALFGARNEVHVIAGTARGAVQVDRREIVAAGWFAPEALPADRSETIDQRLGHFAELLEQV